MSETVLALLIALTEASLAPDETASDAMTRTNAAMTSRRSIPRRKLNRKLNVCGRVRVAGVEGWRQGRPLTAGRVNRSSSQVPRFVLLSIIKENRAFAFIFICIIILINYYSFPFFFHHIDTCQHAKLAPRTGSSACFSR